MSAPRLFELPERGVVEVGGADRVRWLDGMLTNEVKGLAAGGARSGCHALALTLDQPWFALESAGAQIVREQRICERSTRRTRWLCR